MFGIERRGVVGERVQYDPNGQITATIRGKSSYEGELPPKTAPWPEPGNSMAKKVENVAWAIARMLQDVNTYPFEGSFKGRVGEGDISGSYSVTNTKLGLKQPIPNYRVGTWKASRQ